MPKIIPLEGKKFYKLTVIKLVGRTKTRAALWECKCDCGNTVNISSAALRRHRTRSCKCYQKQEARKRQLLRPYESTYNLLLSVAKRRKHSCLVEFTYEEFLNFTKIIKCHYCYKAIVWYAERRLKQGKGGSCYNLDKKDSKGNYTIENCVVCCARCNRGKSDLFSYDEWYKMTECFRKEKLQ